MAESSNLFVQNQELIQEVKRRVDQISAINSVAALVGQSLDLSVTLDEALQAVVEVTGAEAAGISLIDETAQEVVLRAQLGWVNDFVDAQPMRIPLGEGMSGRVINNDETIVHNFLDGSEEYAAPSFREEDFHSIVLTPMHARGSIIGILSIMSPYSGRFTPELVNVLESIADTVAVAIDNARLYEQQVEEEERLSAILQSTADGIIATNQQSIITLVNQAAEDLLSVQASDLIDCPLREAPIQPKVREQLLRALRSNPDQNDTFQVTMPDERQLSVLVSSVQVERQVEQHVDADGWVMVLRDVTHLRQAEIARAQFIKAAAHDMRNPLGVTDSSIKLLERIIESDDERIAEIIGMARIGIRRLQQLIDDLLQIETIESGLDFHISEVDIREFAHEIRFEVLSLMEEMGLTCTLEIDEAVPRDVQVDRNWMKRALHNYLENATKYNTEAGGSILLKIFMENGMLHFEVIDDGPGISATAQPRLFERFYRVNDDSKTKGSGLGLAIVKSVAEAHGGNVYVRSKLGEGSTFGLSIPHIDDHAV